MKKFIGVLLMIGLLVPVSVFAQCAGFTSPEPTCIRVLDNGDVEIDFDINTMGGPTPAQIDSFALFHSATGVIPFPTTPVAVLPVTALPWPTTFTHVGANANTQNAYYFIVAYCAGPPSTPLLPSSIIRAIRLNTSVTGDFFVTLSWNYDSLSTTLIPTVNRKLPKTAAAFNNIGSPVYLTGPMSFKDTIISCLETAKYQIKFTYPVINCESWSSVDSVEIRDLTPPTTPVIDTISFDESTNMPLISWKPNPSTDVATYDILHMIQPEDCNGSFKVIGTVLNPNATSFIDPSAYDGQNVTQFKVQAIDACGNKSVFSECAKTMQLSTLIDVCEKSVRLDWTHYENFNSPDPVLYKIFVSVNGANYSYIDETFDNFFNHTDPVQNSVLKYKIVAFENGTGRTASSNRVLVDAEFLKQPKYQYLRYATVDEDHVVKLELYTDVQSDAASYILKRALDTSFVFNTVNVFHAPKPKIPGDSIVFMSDVSPLTDQHHYYYKVDLFDSCNSYMTTSNVATTIHLSVTPDQNSRVNKLVWNNIIGWQGGTFAYKIYRFLDGKQLRDPLTKFPDAGGNTVFYDSLLLINDNLTAGNPSKGNYCYYVEAIENEPSFKRLLPAREVSNEVCVVQEPYITVPSAFTPNGDNLNETFIPVAVYHDIVNYEFYVMNRYGQVIYLTNSVGQAWDGTHEGKEVPEGTYVYNVKYKSSTGQQFEKSGTVQVVR